MATRLDLSHAQWELAHVEIAYTNLNQIAYLLNKAGISPEIYTQHPVNASKQLTLNNLKQYIVSDNMGNTGTVSAGGSWEAHAGRCTAFCLKAAKRLETQGGFDFRIYNLDKHRLARCERTAIVLDSSARSKAIEVPERDSFTIETTKIRKLGWKFFGGKMGMARASSDGRLGNTETHSRSIMNKTPHFHAIIEWKFTNEKANEKRMKVADWKGVGTRAYVWGKRSPSGLSMSNVHTIMQCRQDLRALIDKNSGPKGRRQWRQLKEIHDRLWSSLCKTYGYPVLEKS
ncbi:hypothetical protein BKA59DRAFT_460237 [Fusarium tricinctum]|uniref:Uncharacterized protein n=1 Tax=Fusarium tricinctum TaxID=61284 RepID=A0A8K0W623_9HYPO|nr:hypothetical protein BKA59DRAFT_460237 [Fusarium tricinctum]